jgi:putative spermidine/putrescine transport system ATP-binding protein
MAEIRVEGLVKAYGTARALDDVTLRFADGGFFGLLGPSGSGKTTLLRAIAGFVAPDRGRVWIGERDVTGVPVEDRQIGMVFQNYALFPNMTVAQNVGFGLQVRGVTGAAQAARVAEALDLVQLGAFAGRMPSQLSGGQRQRVAMARAIAPKPRLLLLDEPLSALDKALRVDMQIELKRIQREVGITTIFVTHDQEEALSLSDSIGILKDGRLIRHGPPRAVYHAPGDAFTARFLGEANILSGSVEAGGLRLADGALVPGITAQIAVRPEALQLSAVPLPGALRARIVSRVFGGAMGTVVMEWQGQTLKATGRDADFADLPEAGAIWVSWPQDQALALD